VVGDPTQPKNKEDADSKIECRAIHSFQPKEGSTLALAYNGLT
jgi:hypothetical protein